MSKVKSNEIELEYGMLLRAKKKLRTSDRSYNRPQLTHVEKDTVVIIVNEGTERGDVGCQAIGLFKYSSIFGHQPIEEYFVPIPDLSDGFFREGHRSRCPYDKGIADTDCWELVGHLKGDEFKFFQKQAPCNTQVPLVVVKDNNDFKLVVGSWDGWSLIPPFV